MKFWIRLSALVLAAWPGCLCAEIGRPILKSFGIRETGASDKTYWCSAQDERGVMYFGSDVVTTFDGERWSQHAVPGTDVVRALSIGESGRVWVGALNELGYFDRNASGGLGNYRSLVRSLPADHGRLGDVWHAFANGKGAVFVTSDTVLIWDGQAFRSHAMPGERRLPAFQIDESTYVNHRATGIWVLESDKPRQIVTSAELDAAGASWMESAADGWLVASTNGLVRISKDGRAAFAPAASEFMRQNVLTSACRLRNGYLCVGTLGGIAIIKANGDLEKILKQEDGLPSRSTTSVVAAQDDALWITSSLSITRISIGNGITRFDSRDGLRGRPCNGIVQNGSDLFVSTDNGVFSLSLFSGNDSAHFRSVPAMSARYVDLTSGAEGLYAAGYGGVFWTDGESLSQVFRTKVQPILLSRSALHLGEYLLADDFELVRLSADNHGELQSKTLAHLPEPAIAIAEDDSRTVWVGTGSRGAYRLKDTPNARPEPVKFDGQPYLGRALVGRIGTAIAVCTNKGIELHRPDSTAPLRVAAAPETNPLAISNAAPDGSVWLASASPFADGTRVPAIGRLSLEKGEARWQPFAVSGLDQAGNVNRLYVDDRGILWAGGTEALLRIDPALLKPVEPPRTPLLSGSVSEKAEVQPEDNTVTFQFSAVEFGRRESLRFQTRLSGGADWAPPTDNSHLTLAGLSDGSYEFAVRVVNDAGMTSPAATWHFTVLPPWYRTHTALAVWVALVAMGFVGGVHWRSRYLRRQNLQLEALVQKKTEQLERANAAKSDFIANMSHEIRNPISGIVGLSLAIEETPLTERQRQLADSIRSCAALLATLVDDVLDFSKIEAGRIELRSEAFDLRASLEQCAAMLAEDLRTTGTTIELSFAPEVPARVTGDSARVQQIVLNYLTNAVKFGAGRPVLLGATAIDPGRVRLFVRDRGPGMSAAEATTLFTKFTRLDRARTQNIRGSGLGLAVCRLLATKMGGSVGVESQIGQGSCFWAELPLPVAEPGAGPRPAAPAAKSTPLHALIVEDIDYNATAMQAVLRKLGISSDIASDGPSALRLLQSDRYDVAFMDWNLPGMIGTEVVSRYRALEPPDRRTVIIATTAYSAAFNREACLEAGMDAFIAKPFTPEKISAALRDLHGSLRAAASLEVIRHIEPTDGPAPEDGHADVCLDLLRIRGEDAEPPGLGPQIEQYLAVFDAEREAAHAAVRGGNAKEIHRVAHRLVSHATMVKYEPLAQLASQLQAHSATAEPERLARLLADFDAEFARFRSKLDAIRSSPAPA